ncbi:MAG: hypothetical protein MJ252_14060 [archaeon]|nr:hypothetical protein [archaeon]
MMNKDLELIENTLKGLLNPNNEERRISEQQLAELLMNKPKLCYDLGNYLSIANDKLLITYSLVIIRKILDQKEEEEDISVIWKNLTKEMKENLEQNVLNLLKKNQDLSLGKKICDVISMIYENVSNSEEKWEDALRYIVDGFKADLQQQNFLIIQNSLCLLSKIFNYAYSELKEGANLFINGFNNFFKSNFLSIKAYSSLAICEILTGISDKKFKKEFKNFIFNCLQTILECLNQKDESNLKLSLFALNDLAQMQPGLLNKNFSDIFTLMGKIFETTTLEEDALRTISLEVILSIIEKNNKIITSDKEKMTIIINSIFKYGMEIEDDIDEEWRTPKSLTLADESFIPEEKLDEAMLLLDRYILALGKKNSLIIISNSIMELLQHSNENWKYKYIAYIAIGKISEHVDDINELTKIITMIFNDLNNENPKIRYACVSCISQFGENFRDNFTELYHSQIYPPLMNLFTNEPILRVKCQISDAFQSCIEQTSKSTINTYQQSILDTIFNSFIKSDEECPQLLRETILDTLGELLSNVKDDFIPFSEKCFLILFEYFKKLVMGNTSNINLFSVLVELLTKVGEYCNTLFLSRASDIAQTLILFQNSISNFKGSVGAYLEQAWTRLIPVLKEKHQQLIPQVIESIIKVVSHPPEVSIASDPGKKIDIQQFMTEINKSASNQNKLKIEKEKFSLNTSETEEYVIFLTILNLYLEQLKEYIQPMLQLVENEAQKIISYPNNDIRSEASKIFPLLIKAIEDKCDPNNLLNYIKNYLSLLIECAKKEKENFVLSDMLNSIQDLLEGRNKIFTTEELNKIFGELFSIFDKVELSRLSLLADENESEKKIASTKLNKEADDEFESDFEEENLDNIRDEIEEVESALIAFSDAVGAIFKTHKELSFPIAKKLLLDVLPNYFKADSSNFEKKMGLFILDDMTESLGQDLLFEVWDDIGKILIQYSDSPISELRQAGVYGLGQFVVQTKNNYEKYGTEIINAIDRGLKISDDGDLQVNYLAAKDNIVATLGRVIKHKGSFYGNNLQEMINIWLENLPIITDTQESEGMHDLLCDIVMQSPALAFGANNQNIPKIIKILCTVVESKKYSNDDINKKIFKIFEGMKGNSNFTQAISEAKKIAKKSVVAKITKYLE